MSLVPAPRHSILAEGIYGRLHPIRFGFLVATLIFDVIHSRTAALPWDKSAAWLIVLGNASSASAGGAGDRGL
jgi:uncharacterized membrane protein